MLYFVAKVMILLRIDKLHERWKIMVNMQALIIASSWRMLGLMISGPVAFSAPVSVMLISGIKGMWEFFDRKLLIISSSPVIGILFT